MKLGRFTIEQLSEGQFEIFADGTIHRRPADSSPGKPRRSFAKKSSSRIGIDPVFITDGTYNILLDTGLGWGLDAGSGYHDVSNVKTNLDIFDKTPEDITHVFLTHLHYDHMAGSSYTSPEFTTLPTFPNARYYVQKREWEYALSLTGAEKQTPGAGYQLDDMYRLIADSQVEFLEEDFSEPLPGIKVLWTGGHTPGHQVIRIEDEGHTAYYLGDLLPSEYHLNHYAMRQMDIAPLQSKKMKIQLLKTACEENAVLLFYHSLYSKAGVLGRDKNKKFVLKKV